MSIQEEIPPQLFEHLVRLASLQLGASEAEYLRQELNHQLQSIRELTSIQIPPGVEMTVHGIPYPPGLPDELREDIPVSFNEVRELLNQAPDLVNDQFAVPDVPHTTLE
jgi:aspartyl/glutamyl-tRNA(Asn/Gln) amidotransferase C subunit